ncbi:toll-like receptor 7 [Clavelina lepadiformis]|uniref:toll-like receptor 7 n=1 Tax=Clavelina lepadiformis TaxID=159417 RepID=UPI004041581D
MSFEDELLLTKIFRIFPAARKISLRKCGISNPRILLRNSQVTSIDLSENKLPELPMETLWVMRDLLALSIYSNKISQLDRRMFDSVPRLTYLDLSNNEISYICRDFFAANASNLRTLFLRNNYISQITSDIFPMNFLEHIEFLDIRLNSISCSCELTTIFGKWLTKAPYTIVQRVGILPKCTPLIDSNYGGCVKCFSSGLFADQSLLSYSANITCQSDFYFNICVSFSSFIIAFIVAGLVFTSKRWKLWLASYATKAIMFSEKSYDDDDNDDDDDSFAFHACVVYDKENRKVGDWVDQHMIPNLTNCPPFFKMTVNGRDDQCGSLRVNQLLMQIQSNRKTIAILTGDYCKSNVGRYVLSVLEYLKYSKGRDKAVLITFERDVLVGDMIRRRLHDHDWSLSQVPEDEDTWPMFWDGMRLALTI